MRVRDGLARYFLAAIAPFLPPKRPFSSFRFYDSLNVPSLSQVRYSRKKEARLFILRNTYQERLPNKPYDSRRKGRSHAGMEEKRSKRRELYR